MKAVDSSGGGAECRVQGKSHLSAGKGSQNRGSLKTRLMKYERDWKWGDPVKGRENLSSLARRKSRRRNATRKSIQHSAAGVRVIIRNLIAEWRGRKILLSQEAPDREPEGRLKEDSGKSDVMKGKGDK